MLQKRQSAFRYFLWYFWFPFPTKTVDRLIPKKNKDEQYHVEKKKKGISSNVSYNIVLKTWKSWFLFSKDANLTEKFKIIRSNHLEVFCKRAVLKNLTKSTGKHLCQSLKPTTLLRNRLWHSCFPMNFAKFLRTSFFIEHLHQLLLNHTSPYNQFSKIGAKDLASCFFCSRTRTHHNDPTNKSLFKNRVTIKFKHV